MSNRDFDYIIDVRTPSEFSYSHIPEALNLPVFIDEEYSQVGTLYKHSPMEAKILGAGLACSNIAKILISIQNDSILKAIFHPKNKILIYCARGGNRSESLYLVLKTIGLRVEKLHEGYKGYRNEVVSFFSNPIKQNFLTLCGNTGCGKTEIIQNLKNDSINLENIANHYGSSFGYIGTQPTQKMFENLLFERLRKLQKIIIIESESKKIGSLVIPKNLFQAYHNAPKILIQAPLEDRIKRILSLYKNISDENFLNALDRIKPYIQKNIFIELKNLWENKELEKIILILIEKYYDRVYKTPQFNHIINNIDLFDSIREILELKKYYEKNLNPS